jgi:serine/threonine protein kinase
VAWQHVAIKKTAPTVLDKQNGPIREYRDVEARCAEILTLLRLRESHPESSPVLYLYEYFWKFDRRSPELYMVSELLDQELDQWRQEQTVFMESAAKQIASVLLNALDFMHSRKVVHRDIKLQNVLFRVKGNFNTLKVVDFGLAKTLDNNESARDFCGSLGYIAPEIYKGEEYKYEVDIFALGVIVFRLLSGARPFSSTNTDKLRRDTIDLKYSIKGRSWENVSPQALKIVRKLLIGKEQRLTALQAIDHEWFSTTGDDSILRADYTAALDYVPQNDGYSEAIALVSLTY